MTGAPQLPRFLCDRMLLRLARYLRAAGYDTALVAPDEGDEACLDRLAREGRILLSRDRDLVRRAASRGRAVLLAGNGLEAAAGELARQLGIDWLAAPFSRCLVDNAVVVPADADARSRLPPRARALGGEITACPVCGRLYWRGSHVRRMAARLRRWQDGREAS